MNVSAPDGPQPGAGRSEGAALRFLRWLVEPPVESQPAELRVLRWLLRAVVFLLYCFVVGEVTPGYDGQAGGWGGVGRKNGKPGKPPA